MTADGAWRNVTGHWPPSMAFGLTTASAGILVSPGPFWCGISCNPVPENSDHSYFANPATLALTRHWTRLPALPGHPLLSASPVWTGSELLTLTTAGNLLVLHSQSGS